MYLEIARRKLINDHCSLDERHFSLYISSCIVFKLRTAGAADPKEGGKTEPVHGQCFGHVSGGDAYNIKRTKRFRLTLVLT